MRSLSKFVRSNPDTAKQVALLIYDNSPGPQALHLDDSAFASTEYHHAPENGGLAAAYNHAITRARESSLEWLLLLDQDTSMSPLLFTAVFAALGGSLQEDVCAIVPKLVQEEMMLSPQIVGRFRNHDLSPGFAGVAQQVVTALNSAACLRVAAVLAVGGFPQEYWLDFLDHVMFSRLQAAGGKVLILDVALEHRLSWNNLEAEMSLDRYTNLLASEWRFIRESGRGGGPGFHRLRLLKRVLSQAVRMRNLAFASVTLRALAG